MTLLLRMSLIGAGMILTVALLRLLLQRRVHRSVFLALWAIAALRLLVPVFIPTGMEIALPPQTAQSFAATAVRTIVDPTQLRLSETAAFSLAEILPWIWLSVAAALLTGFAVSHLRQRRSFRFSVPMPEEAGLAPNVRLLDGLASPLTYGIFRPVILLPVEFDWRDSQKLTQVLAHERTHIRHRDVLVKSLMLLACCLHWFNPAVWLMFYLASQDMEMRCDAAVVRALGKGGKLSYARTLIETERERTFGGALQTGFSVNNTARRLKALAKAKVQPILSALLALFTVVMAGVGFFTVNAASEHVELPNLSMPGTSTAAKRNPSVRTRLPSEQVQATEPTAPAPDTSEAPTEPPEPTETTQPSAPALQISAIPSMAMPGEQLYVTLTGDPTARLVSDQPSVLAIQGYTESAPNTLDYVLCAYGSGTANIYCDNGAGSVLVATVTVRSTVQQEEREPSFMGEDYQPQIDFDPSDGPAGDLSWFLNGEETP